MSDENDLKAVAEEIEEPVQNWFSHVKTKIYDEMVKGGFSEEQSLKVVAHMITTQK